MTTSRRHRDSGRSVALPDPWGVEVKGLDTDHEEHQEQRQLDQRKGPQHETSGL